MKEFQKAITSAVVQFFYEIIGSDWRWWGECIHWTSENIKSDRDTVCDFISLRDHIVSCPSRHRHNWQLSRFWLVINSNCLILQLCRMRWSEKLQYWLRSANCEQSGWIQGFWITLSSVDLPMILLNCPLSSCQPWHCHSSSTAVYISTVSCPVSTVNFSAHYSEFSPLIIPFAPNPSSLNLFDANLSAAITRPLLTCLQILPVLC